MQTERKQSILQLFQHSFNPFIPPVSKYHLRRLGLPSQSPRTFSLDVLTLSYVRGYYSV